MIAAIEARIRRWLDIPGPPDPPAGDPASQRLFQPAHGFFRYRRLEWILDQAGKAIGFVVGLVVLRRIESFLPQVDAEILEALPVPSIPVGNVILGLELLAIAFFLVQLPFSYAFLILDLRCRWYIVTDRSLRIREGRWRIQERTMTYSNIQKISVRQGPVQRFFGIADLEVRTAGGGSVVGGGKHAGARNLHVGYFRGVDNAEEIRELIREHQRRVKAGGGAELEERVPTLTPAGAGEEGDPLAAARRVLEEARALGRALG